jgi:hypothetical protein
MTTLTDEERQTLLRLIDARLMMLSGRLGGIEYHYLVTLRRKLEGVDKRVMIFVDGT